MKEFDVIVIGAGSGLHISSAAAEQGLSVAIVEEGPMGGTCLNRGCIPSKMIIHSADVAETISTSHLFGVISKIQKIDFARVTRRASAAVDKEAREIEESIRHAKNMELFKKRGRFVGERTIAVGSKKIRGRKVVVAAGTRPSVPLIEGLQDIEYLTSDNAMRITKQPKSMIILGGGYIAAELGHFFGALGTKVTILQRSVMLREEDREIAEAFTHAFSKKHKVVLGYTPKEAKKKSGGIYIIAENQKKRQIKLSAESLLVATGRVPNTDLLDVKKGGIAVNEKGFVKVNKFLETTAPGTWALGDIVGKYLLKHSANLEAEYVWHNAFTKHKHPVDYWPMGHAIFTSPQIAAAGYTEQELQEMKKDYAKGVYHYKDTGMGLAIAEENGFAKILADRRSRKILGCHIMGPEAPTLIHEAIIAMKCGLTADQLAGTVHIHPAASEVVQRAAGSIDWGREAEQRFMGYKE
ncbi:MAG: dihydrolipoyl dehydrogenase [Candidatus Aenigmarchaeota archaeon]|nr:dihydrolipoyl dehydrogenase [Candidatus Aenigmarchaeota archaeon]